MIKTASALGVLGVLLVVGSCIGAGRTVETDAAASILAYHRAEFERVRDALRTSWLRYIAPLVPGMTVMILARIFEVHAPGRPLEFDYAW